MYAPNLKIRKNMVLERGFNSEARWLLPETTVLIPADTWELMTICKLQFQGSNTCFWPLGTTHIHDIFTYMQTNYTPTHKKLNLKKKEWFPWNVLPFLKGYMPPIKISQLKLLLYINYKPNSFSSDRYTKCIEMSDLPNSLVT